MWRREETATSSHCRESGRPDWKQRLPRAKAWREQMWNLPSLGLNWSFPTRLLRKGWNTILLYFENHPNVQRCWPCILPLKWHVGGFSGSPVVRLCASTARGMSLIPSPGTKIPQPRKKKKNLNKTTHWIMHFSLPPFLPRKISQLSFNTSGLILWLFSE